MKLDTCGKEEQSVLVGVLPAVRIDGLTVVGLRRNIAMPTLGFGVALSVPINIIFGIQFSKRETAHELL